MDERTALCMHIYVSLYIHCIRFFVPYHHTEGAQGCYQDGLCESVRNKITELADNHYVEALNVGFLGCGRT